MYTQQVEYCGQLSPVQSMLFGVPQGSVCLVNVNVWLSAIQLWLNASNTQLMWLRLTQLLDKITCQDVLMLGTCMTPSLTQPATLALSMTVSCHWQCMSHLSVVPATISYASSEQWSACCQCMQPRCWSRRSSCATWIIATHCFIASMMAYYTTCSWCRTRLRTW